MRREHLRAAQPLRRDAGSDQGRAQPPTCSTYCGMRCRATPGSESTGAGGLCPAAHCTACFRRGPVPTSLFNNLTRVARPAYRWARKPEGGGGCKSAGQPCSAFAVCMSGSLRSFWSTRLNIEHALLLPNGPADLFAHVYYEPRRHDHRRGLQWLRNAPYSQAVVAEVFDETLEEDLVAGFVEYQRLRAEDTFGITTQGKETSAWLSMLRKLQLANELRKAHEARRGRPYLAVVRSHAARDRTTTPHPSACDPMPTSPPCVSTHTTRGAAAVGAHAARPHVR